MATALTNEIKLFKGLKNDEDQKQIPFDYFYRMTNFNYPEKGILGCEKILMPKRIEQIGTSPIDGIFEYRFLDSGNVLRKEIIAVTNGTIYKDAFTATPTTLKSGLMPGKCSFAVFNDKLYIANGLNYINIYDGNLGIVTEMGAPFAKVSSTIGNLTGNYYYAITYVTAGGEEVLGSISNTVSPNGEKVILSLPLGYAGTTDRKVYRTVAGGSNLLLVGAVGNNTDLTYLDDVADGSLTTSIPPLGDNELPKPYFLLVSAQKLFACRVAKFPTQLFITDTNIDVIDTASALDISNYGFDNTPVNGMGSDFNKVIVGTDKNIFFVDPSDNSVILTRSNVGIKNGYSVKQVPATATFPGGIMFVSTLNDVRVVTGMQALAVTTTLDNIRTENWSQAIRGTLDGDLQSSLDMSAEFYKYKYHLCLNNVKYVFDVRTNGWSYHDIRTDSYQSQPVVLAVIEDQLYNGQIDGWIEQEYTELQYRSEDVMAYIESPYMDANRLYKVVEKMMFWFYPSINATVNIEVTTDNNTLTTISDDVNFTNEGGVFAYDQYRSEYFDVDSGGLDYRIVNINKPCRWIKYRLTCETGNISFQGFGIFAQQVKNKE